MYQSPVSGHESASRGWSTQRFCQNWILMLQNWGPDSRPHWIHHSKPSHVGPGSQPVSLSWGGKWEGAHFPGRHTIEDFFFFFIYLFPNQESNLDPLKWTCRISTTGPLLDVFDTVCVLLGTWTQKGLGFYSKSHLKCFVSSQRTSIYISSFDTWTNLGGESVIYYYYYYIWDEESEHILTYLRSKENGPVRIRIQNVWLIHYSSHFSSN